MDPSAAKRPLGVTIIGCLYALVGAAGLVAHFGRLAVAWIAFHVLSFGSLRQLIIHSLFLVPISWTLFRADAGRFFPPDAN